MASLEKEQRVAAKATNEKTQHLARIKALRSEVDKANRLNVKVQGLVGSVNRVIESLDQTPNAKRVHLIYDDDIKAELTSNEWQLTQIDAKTVPDRKTYLFEFRAVNNQKDVHISARGSAKVPPFYFERLESASWGIRDGTLFMQSHHGGSEWNFRSSAIWQGMIMGELMFEKQRRKHLIVLGSQGAL